MDFISIHNDEDKRDRNNLLIVAAIMARHIEDILNT